MTLLKVNFISVLYGLFQFRRRKNKAAKRTVSLAFISLIPIAVIAYIGFYGNMAASVLIKYDLMWMLLAVVFFLCSITTLPTSFYAMNEILFSGKDLDLLLSLPVKRWQILASKLSALMIENWLLDLMMVAPALCVYWCYQRPPLLFFIANGIFAVLFLSMIPIVLAGILSYFINIISLGTHFKMLFRVIFSIALVMGLSVLPTYLIASFSKIVEKSGDLFSAIKKTYPPVGFLTDSIFSQKPLSLLAFIAISVIPFALFIVLASGKSAILWSKTSNIPAAKNKKYRIKTSTQMSSLFRRELNRLFTSYIYLLNTTIGMLMMIAAAVIMIFTKNKMEPLFAIPEINAFIVPVIAIGFCFMAGISITTAPSISLEGSSLWIIKSCPVDVKKLFLAKLMLNWVVVMPLLLISSIIVSITFKLTVIDFLIIFTVPAILSFLVSCIGLIINLHMPRCDMKNDVAVVKQSGSVMITMLISLLAIGAIAAPYPFISKHISMELYGVITIVFLAGLCAVAYTYLFRKGKFLFERITA